LIELEKEVLETEL
jgi:hypothetical protein